MSNFRVTDAAKDWLASKNLEKLFVRYGDPAEMLEPVLTKKVEKVISGVKKKIEIPEGVNVPNWNLEMNDLLNDTEVFVITDEDLYKNLQVQVRNRFSGGTEAISVSSLMNPGYLPDPWVLREIRDLEEQRQSALLPIYQFLYELIKYLDYLHKEGVTPNRNILRLLIESLSKICNAPISDELKNGFWNVRNILISLICGESVEWPKNFNILLLFLSREIRILIYKKYPAKWDKECGEKSLAKLAERILGTYSAMELLEPGFDGKTLGLDFDKKVLPVDIESLNEIAAKLESKRKLLWGDHYTTDIDWLGCYCPATGTIFLRIDRIFYEYQAFCCYYKTIYFILQEVLLHEFIHAALDLCPRDSAGKVIMANEKWQDGNVNEETLDNVIVLYNYYNNSEHFYDIYNLISNQPFYYSYATKLYRKYNGRILSAPELRRLFMQLIRYKLFVGKV